MSIKLISVKCPDCGARLDIEEGRKMAFCSYCGAKILIKDENEYTFRHIDETGIKKAEIDSKIRMRQLEIEASNSRQSNKIRQLLTYIWIGSLFVIGAMVIIVWLTSDLGWISAFNTFFYIGGPIVGGGAYLLFKVIPEKENEKYVLADGGRRLPKYQGGYMGQNYEMIRKMFISKGFTNVTCVNMHDVTLGLMQKPNLIESVTVNGERVLNGGKVVLPDSEIVITYHGR